MVGTPPEQKRIGKYTVLRMLGRGGAGVVYECLDPDLDRSVAIKNLLPAEDAEGQEHLERFRREAQALARMAHPNIVRIYDYDDRSEDFPFIVMEFVESGSLRQLLDPDHPMPPARAVSLVCQVLAGLAATHRIGVIHRDIKPGNILMRGDLPLLADFGIARIADKRSTMVGTVIGTAHYMAPEQLLGGEIDERADIWSTGVLLYQMLTGRQPFDGANALAIMDAIRNSTPVPPSEHCLPGLISGALDQVVLKALAKRPEDRYASADAFAQALEEAMHAPSELDRTIVVTPARPPPPAPAPAARKASPPLPLILGGAAAIVAAGIGVTVWLLSATPMPVPVARPAEPRVEASVPTPDPAAVRASNQGTPAPVVAEPAPSAAPSPGASVPPAVLPSPTPPPVVAAPMPQPGPPPASLPPVVVAPEPPPPARPVLADLRDLLSAADCAVIGGTLEPGRMILNGLGASDLVTPMRDLWTTLRDSGQPNGGSRFDVTGLARVPGLCEALGLVRPFAPPLGSTRRPVSVRVEAKGPRLVPDVGFSLSVGMPDFAGWIQVDYFSFADNAVLHVGLSAPRAARQPTPLPQAIQLSAGETALVFNGSAGSPGEDLVIAIASRDRLFAQPRPEIEDARTYLAALRAALEGRASGSVGAVAIPVIIGPPP